MVIGLIVAMQSEFDLIANIMENVEIKTINHLCFLEGNIENNRIIVMKSGIGKVNAAIACVEMIRNFNPEEIINTGIAGGIDRELSVMDMVLGKKVVYHDVWCGEGNEYGQVQGLPCEYDADETLLKKAQEFCSDIKVIPGFIVTGDKFIDNLEVLQNIKKQFPAGMAVDMESAAIAQACYLYNVPFLSVRIISDTPGIENQYEQYNDFWNKAPKKTLEIIKYLIS